MTADELVATFATVWGDRDAGDLRPDAGVKLLALCNRARLAHPSLANDPQFVVAIASHARSATGGSIAAVDGFLARCHPEDLVLAVAASRGEQAAIAEIERAYRMTIDSTCRRFASASHTADDLKQILRARLFGAEAGRAPKIADYAGQGQLESWLRVTAVRVFLDLAPVRSGTQRGRIAHTPEPLTPAPDGLAHVLAVVNINYRDAVARAMHDAAKRLEPGDRHLLRQHFVAGLSIDQLGAVLGIDRETTARRIARAREKLVADTRTELAHWVALTHEELADVTATITTRLDVAIGPLLATAGTPP